MRGFLLFLAFGFAAVLLSPGFWMLWSMDTGALQMTLIHQDGRRQETMNGPKAPWAAWAPIPQGAQLTVRAWFGPSPPDPETGFGDATFDGEPPAVAAAFAEKLEREGWTVSTTLLRQIEPTLPPRPLVRCVVRAIRTEGDPRSILASFELEPPSDVASIHWYAAPRPHITPISGEACQF